MIYEVIMSKGSAIRIDEEDLKHIKENISSTLIRVKEGIINPSFMVMIVPTKEEDVIIRKITEIGEDRIARITGEERIPKLSDLMSDEVKKLK